MKLQDVVGILENSDIVRVVKDDTELFCGYLALFIFDNEKEEKFGKVFERYKEKEVKKIRAIPEITHKKWKEKGLDAPLRPEQTPDFRFSDLQLKIYYTINI